MKKGILILKITKQLLFISLLLYSGFQFVDYHNKLQIMIFNSQTQFNYSMSIYDYHNLFYPLVQWLIIFSFTLGLYSNDFKIDWNLLIRK